MQERRFFYDPEPGSDGGVLTADEAAHALRVLRLGAGDPLHVIDGRGNLIAATITETTRHECRYHADHVEHHDRPWPYPIHLSVAPTKNIDRMEWLVEKATEIGVDRITFLDCQFSERRVIKPERLRKIAIAAMKQSHKLYLPQIDDMQPFARFFDQSQGPTFIAHCYDDGDLLGPAGKPFLLDALSHSDAPCLTVAIGPEGDFSAEEVRLALSKGSQPVSLGTSRLRTETAALVAVHLMQIAERESR